MHEIDNLIAQTCSFHLAVSLADQSAGNGDVEMHDAGYVGCVDDREILLVCTCQRGQCSLSLLELGCGDVLLLATCDFIELQVDARTWETRGDKVHFSLFSFTNFDYKQR